VLIVKNPKKQIFSSKKTYITEFRHFSRKMVTLIYRTKAGYKNIDDLLADLIKLQLNARCVHKGVIP
jgi:hypothetical protein